MGELLKIIHNRNENFRLYKKDIEVSNLNTLFAISLIGTVICFLLALFSMPVVGILKLFEQYVILFFVFLFICVSTKTILVKQRRLILPEYYFLTIVIDSIAIYMGTFLGRETNATTFLLFLLLLPLFIVDYTWRISLINILMSGIFIYVAEMVKPAGAIRFLDVSNTISVCVISILFTYLSAERNMKIYRLRNLEKTEINKKDLLINTLPVGIAVFEVKDNVTKQIFVNDEFFRLFEDTSEARIKRTGGNFINGIHPDDRAKLLKGIKRVIDGEDYLTMPCRSMKGDGTYMWVKFSSSVAERGENYLKVYSTYSSMEEEMKSKQATIAKTEFLSRMSHDIRTPMNAIIGMTKLSLEETDIDVIKGNLKNINTSSKFLLGLINDILDMSKIESGEFELNPEPYGNEEFNATMNTMIRPLMDKKNIDFTFSIQVEPTWLLIDKLRFNQIFLNLLSNASKFTPIDGKVEFVERCLAKEGNKRAIQIIIKDNGIGMSEEFKKNMFTPFSQERTALNQNTQGTGLGLPIVKSLVEAMNGTIKVNSKLGEGTEYILDFCFEDVTEEHKKQKAEKKISKAHNTDINLLKNKNILLVEDNEMNILVAKTLLERKECNVFVANDGQEAVDIVEQSQEGFYEAILMDVRMPVMNGLDATRAIRALDREDVKTVPIIAMTADAFSEEQKKTLDAGMNYHLTKPIEPKKLYAALEQYL